MVDLIWEELPVPKPAVVAVSWIRIDLGGLFGSLVEETIIEVALVLPFEVVVPVRSGGTLVEPVVDVLDLVIAGGDGGSVILRWRLADCIGLSEQESTCIGIGHWSSEDAQGRRGEEGGDELELHVAGKLG